MSDAKKSICRVVHNKNYTVVNNHICKDKTISYKAKGIWLYAFSRPDDWQFYLCDIINQSTDGRESVRSGIDELEKAGYLTREQLKGENGKFSSYIYTFYELPSEIKISSPLSENPIAVDTTAENNPLSSTEAKPSTESINTESSSSKSSSSFDDPCGADDDSGKNIGENIWFRKTNGQMKKITLSEIYLHFIKLTFSTETVTEAISRFKILTSPINNALKYLESICVTIDKEKENKPSKAKETTAKAQTQEKPKTQEQTITFEEYFKCQNKPNPFRSVKH